MTTINHQPPTNNQTDPRSPSSSLRESAILKIRNSLRPGQQQMADWYSGPLAVSAVPGAGKSTGMAAAAAIAIARQYQRSNSSRSSERRQLVVVTFTRSAVANIKAKIRKYLRDDLSLPQTGFAVHTLHGLALNIASRHPNLSGLQLDNVTLITPTQSHRFIRTAVEQWIASHPGHYFRLLEGIQFDGEETERLRRQSVLRTEVLPDLATTVIHEAKSSGMLPEDLRRFSEQTIDNYEILTVAAGLYEQYQNLMRSRDFIDYDDMILAALRVLENPSARRIEQNQVFAVFEDEAQDSSPLQTKLLQILATDPNNPDQPNLIRVGDPNQAINSTFTPADPIYFREFCEDCNQKNRLATMDQAGRSTKIIIDAANFVLQWVNSAYQAKSQNFPTPFRPQTIRLVDPDDPQTDANPQPVGRGLELYTPRDIHHTVQLLSQRVIELFAQAPNSFSAAILVRENRQGKWLAEALAPVCKEHQITLYDVGERERHSHVPQEILALLQFCDRPHSPDYLKAALEVFVERQLIPTQDLNAPASVPEEFLYPGPLSPPQPESVQKAAHLCRSLLRARMELPLYQLISFLALALNYDQAELATADKLAERVNLQIASHASMTNMLGILSEIVSSERFEPVETEDLEARYTRRGQLTIITMHKAKGLDWDYVFIPFVHENLIPGRFWVPPQSQFLGDFTLSEVARAQIRAALHNQGSLPDVTQAWEQAKYLKTAEEYRLLYVAMTRAKRLLWMSAAQKAPFTWSKPENLQASTPCPVFPALKRQFPECVV
ncbi:ATP-dependent helicase [Fischerella thermalis]|uniref:ATP-dependent helicase n=1 Tax=Fischerella thermalis TaxID=372787 RepID=UPI000C80D9C4|nr:ATP-dependent helicase [Fischerella thermalis]PMB11896.1 DNA helicase UvrD [Fischerella thermalis CCMEE 5328]PLZ08151.1 DNA helicase UvrD [Fischerella thermalis WC1110]PLZ10702.1 DNA helicase UvrD [Fischerella thermalis WC119]PLZ10985.1 DNA helicase UvrD [Fischerella thermalis WC114]PLZ22008.1 DNA helicase UvrD [Fischerella thermalis WC157]